MKALFTRKPMAKAAAMIASTMSVRIGTLLLVCGLWAGYPLSSIASIIPAPRHAANYQKSRPRGRRRDPMAIVKKILTNRAAVADGTRKMPVGIGAKASIIVD